MNFAFFKNASRLVAAVAAVCLAFPPCGFAAVSGEKSARAVKTPAAPISSGKAVSGKAAAVPISSGKAVAGKAKKRGPASVFQRPSLEDSLDEREGLTAQLLKELCSADSSDENKADCLKTRGLAGGESGESKPGAEDGEDSRQFEFQDMEIRSDRRLSDEIVGEQPPQKQVPP